MVDAVLAAVEGWRRDPFGSVVGLAFSGGPAGGGVVDESVVAAAGQGEFVDVGVAAVLPVALGVVDLAAVYINQLTVVRLGIKCKMACQKKWVKWLSL